MRVKYQRLNKEERKKYRDDYYKTAVGKKVRKNLNHALICSILCFIFSIYLIYEAFFLDNSIINKIYGLSLLAFSIIGFILYYRLRIKKINEYVVKLK